MAVEPCQVVIFATMSPWTMGTGIGTLRDLMLILYVRNSFGMLARKSALANIMHPRKGLPVLHYIVQRSVVLGQRDRSLDRQPANRRQPTQGGGTYSMPMALQPLDARPFLRSSTSSSGFPETPRLPRPFFPPPFGTAFRVIIDALQTMPVMYASHGALRSYKKWDSTVEPLRPIARLPNTPKITFFLSIVLIANESQFFHNLDTHGPYVSLPCPPCRTAPSFSSSAKILRSCGPPSGSD